MVEGGAVKGGKRRKGREEREGDVSEGRGREEEVIMRQMRREISWEKAK